MLLGGDSGATMSISTIHRSKNPWLTTTGQQGAMVTTLAVQIHQWDIGLL